MLTTVVSSLSFAGPALAPASRAPAVNMMAKSQSLPFMDTPPALDGSLPGDVGFGEKQARSHLIPCSICPPGVAQR